MFNRDGCNVGQLTCNLPALRPKSCLDMILRISSRRGPVDWIYMRRMLDNARRLAGRDIYR